MASTALRTMVMLLTEASNALHLTAPTSPLSPSVQLHSPWPHSALLHVQTAVSPLEHSSQALCLAALEPSNLRCISISLEDSYDSLPLFEQD